MSLLPLGAGAKARAKEALRMKLEREGIFDLRLKRPLPRYPERVAVITSPTGAALQDVLKLHALRYPCAEIVVIPSLMQGVGAPEEITAAFERARRIRGLSCLMLVRGGGNRDDLDIFDEESVVRAVRLCPVPVITGLGHQIDSTLADLAADAAAPTPSGAAERLFPDRRALEAALCDAERSMRGALEGRIGLMSRALETAGLDPAVGFLHRDRPGRPGLALDMMEEFRPYLVDRLVCTLINRGQIRAEQFRKTESGAVLMADDLRKEMLLAWQNRKKETVEHPFLKEKMPIGLLWHMQARLLARTLRGDQTDYPPFVMR